MRRHTIGTSTDSPQSLRRRHARPGLGRGRCRTTGFMTVHTRARCVTWATTSTGRSVHHLKVPVSDVPSFFLENDEAVKRELFRSWYVACAPLGWHRSSADSFSLCLSPLVQCCDEKPVSFFGGPRHHAIPVAQSICPSVTTSTTCTEIHIHIENSFGCIVSFFTQLKLSSTSCSSGCEPL